MLGEDAPKQDRRLFYGVFVIVGVLLAGVVLYFLLSKTNQQLIIGKWQANDKVHKDWILEFGWDGTKDVGPATFTTKYKNYHGAYTTFNRAPGVGTLFGSKDHPKETIAIELEISGDELIILDFQGLLRKGPIYADRDKANITGPPIHFHRVPR
jgi:hypothetical protein